MFFCSAPSKISSTLMLFKTFHWIFYFTKAVWKGDYIRREIKIPEAGHIEFLIKTFHNCIRSIIKNRLIMPSIVKMPKSVEECFQSF